MAYSVSTSSGTTAGGAYTFGVGPTIAAGRTVQQSNLASYVQPPIRPKSNNGCVIAILAFVGASVAGVVASSAVSSIAPDAAGGVGAITWIGTLIVIIVLVMRSENQKTKERMEKYNGDMAEWRRWWICLRCGHRWKR